ncbi:MAG: hypothetical protein H0W61_00015 [Bacteroidetes bacterium]|nr:hypothetical protein [Bacteroidota bacterium]
MKKKNQELYEPYLIEVADLFNKSKTEKNPAYWLYLNKARVPLFMLESITRLVYKATNDPIAKKWTRFFKKLEDTLGELDYYDVFIKQFKTNRSVKKEQINYLTNKLNKAMEKWNDKLRRKKFYSDHFHEFRNKATTDFNNTALLIRLHEQIKTEILLTEQFFSKHPNGFRDFEEEVHAMRRKLRWISIYGISLGGIVVLKDNRQKYPWEKEFITKTETESKYNKLPVKKGLPYHIALNKKAFYALSHVIDKLGVIKDKGLAIEALEKSLEKTNNSAQANARVYATRQLKLSESEGLLLKEAYDLAYKFFVDYRIHIELMNV